MEGKHGNDPHIIIFFLTVPYLEQLQWLGHAINPVLRHMLQHRHPLPTSLKFLSSHSWLLGCKVLIVTAVMLTYHRNALTAVLETLTDTPDVPTLRPAQYNVIKTKLP